MTKQLFSFLLVMILFMPYCKKVQKDVNSYYPKVSTTSVTKNPDGSVTVSGTIVSAGSTSIQYCGFCMDTLNNPDMLSNQLLSTNLAGNVFSCTYSALSTLNTYYFRAFAANANGFAIGTTLSSKVSFDTANIPCHPASQYMALTGTVNQTEPYSYVTALANSGTGYELTGYTSDHSIDIQFSQYPISGIYTNASVSVDNNGIGAVTLYVQEISAGIFDITICSASVSVQDMYGTYYPGVMTTKFRTPS